MSFLDGNENNLKLPKQLNAVEIQLLNTAGFPKMLNILTEKEFDFPLTMKLQIRERTIAV